MDVLFFSFKLIKMFCFVSFKEKWVFFLFQMNFTLRELMKKVDNNLALMCRLVLASDFILLFCTILSDNNFTLFLQVY